MSLMVEAFGHMPLKSIDFRADPVLFEIQGTEEINDFVNVGSL